MIDITYLKLSKVSATAIKFVSLIIPVGDGRPLAARMVQVGSTPSTQYYCMKIFYIYQQSLEIVSKFTKLK